MNGISCNISECLSLFVVQRTFLLHVRYERLYICAIDSCTLGIFSYTIFIVNMDVQLY